MTKGSNTRQFQHDVHLQFPDRWSGRALSGRSLTQADMLRLLEAARWAPSASNSQPWRFLYALRDGDWFNTFLDLLVPANRAWADKAGALVLVASRTHADDGRELVNHSYDAGAAWMSLALQASLQGLVAHGIGGFEREKARHVLRVPASHAIEAMIVLGHPGDATQLTEALRAREKPSERRPVGEIACEGPFAF